MKYFSLFTGIGGFELGIGDRGECVGFSEIDKYAIQIYQSHFPQHKNYGDITKIDEQELPEFDLLVGGFPCQSFSIAGKRGGFADTRGTLFFDIARILRRKQPRLLLLENVKGLLSHDDGNTFKTIIAALDELGYDLQWQVLNSKNHGVPQNRERVLIAGHLRGTPRPQVFPFFGVAEEDPCKVASTALDANYWKGADNHGQRTLIVHNVYGGFKEEGVRIFDKTSPTIRTASGGGHIPMVVDLKASDGSTRRGQFSNGDFAKTLDHQCYQGVIREDRVRKLTPIECERLQAFPDNWTSGVSDTQRYKCLGNAVTVNVIRDVIDKMIV